MKAEEFIRQRTVGGSQTASDKQYLEVADVERLLQTVRQDETIPVSILGRKYVVETYTSWVQIPKAIVDFVEKHPEREEVLHQVDNGAERLLRDIHVYLRDAMAVTAVADDSDNPDITIYRLDIPVLMPADTRNRWQCNTEQEFLAYEERLRKNEFKREGYSYKIVEPGEEEREDGV